MGHVFNGFSSCINIKVCEDLPNLIKLTFYLLKYFRYGVLSYF